jgi:radical SAM-linked protein
MNDQTPVRIRIHFHKNDAMRYTGHLDLHKTWERTFRRAGLPLAYTQGFHPQPRLNLACALPLGFTSQSEIVDAWLEYPLPLGDVQTTLARSAPPGITHIQIEEVEPRTPALQTQVVASEYQITFLIPAPELDEKLSEILNAASLPRRRRERAYDLRPLIEHLQRLPDSEAGCPSLLARMAAREGATGRPEELLDAMGYAITQVRIHRTRLFFADQPEP